MTAHTHADADALAARRRALLERMLAEKGLSASPRPDARPGPRDRAPLSSAQRRLWFLQQMDPDTPVYNLTCGIRIRGPLDPQALETALGRVIADHPVLRTAYREEDGEPAQTVLAPGPATLPVLDLPPEAADPGAWTRDTARQAARTPFDLTAGAPLRALLLRLAAEHHVLVAVVHHIAADDQTWGVLFPDLFRHYTALTAAGPGAVPPTAPDTTYADYALWEGARLDEDGAHRRLAHWRRVLSPAPAPLPLPVDRRRDPDAGTRGADTSATVPADVRDALLEVGRSCGATPFMTLFAVFTALLHRVTGARDVCAGTPAVLRDTPELARIAGNFQNTLALRVDLSGDPSLRELLARIRRVCTDAYAHQEVPFERVVADLRPPRAPGRTPFFDVMFLTQEEASAGSSAPGLELSEVPLHNGTTQFDLTLAATAGGPALELTALYRPSLFDEATVRALLDLYGRLARAAALDPDAPIGGLSLLDPAEAADSWRRAHRRVEPSPRTLPEAFAATVAAHPDRTALTHGGEHLTYSELDRRADRLARVLAGGGAGPGTRVLIALPRGLDLVTAMVAATRTGAAYVPVDVDHPGARLAAVAADAAPVLAVTGPDRAGDLPGGIPPVVVDGADVRGPAPADPARAPRPGDPCYVLYTSGSTGTPKGVVVPHRAVVRLLDSTDGLFGFGPDDVWTMFHSCAFDFSVWEVWGPLLRGGRLVIVPADTARSPEDFLGLLERERVTVLNQTPSALWPLAAADAALGPDLALRWIVLGGEALDPARLVPWFERHPDDRPRVVNMYGITETTVHVTHRTIDARTAREDPGSPIGDPLPDLSLHLLDSRGNPVPDLVVGELHVGGAGVALGYLGRPEQTAERFVTGPDAVGGDRLYRSGDLARRRADGRTEYLGRADAQFKVRGFRVEPAEIEAALEAHPHVERAAATVSDDRVGAHIVPAPGTVPDPADLRAHTARTLPSHMVPAVFHLYDTLPLTSNGKLDRVRLASAPPGRRLAAGGVAAVGAGTEAAVAALWRDLLEVDEVGADDNFFDLGGHSLLLTRVRTELARSLGRHLPIADLYAYPTVRSLAAHLDRGGRDGPQGPDARDRARLRRAALARKNPAARRTATGEDRTP